MRHQPLAVEDLPVIESSALEQPEGGFEASVSASAKCQFCSVEQKVNQQGYHQRQEDAEREALTDCLGKLNEMGWCADEKKRVMCRSCLAARWDAALRILLSVAPDAGPQDTANLIRAEGWTPRLTEVILGGVQWWACPVWRGIFGTVEQDDKTGALVQSCYPSVSVALLEGLRKARGVEPLQSI